jgi:hypothetical protein
VTSGAKARHDKKAGYRSAEALRHLKSEFFRNLLVLSLAGRFCF